MWSGIRDDAERLGRGKRTMKTFAPITAYRIGPYFRSWCVKKYRADGTWETVNVCDMKKLAKSKLAEQAAKRGMMIAADGESAALPQEPTKKERSN